MGRAQREEGGAGTEGREMVQSGREPGSEGKRGKEDKKGWIQDTQTERLNGKNAGSGLPFGLDQKKTVVM